MNLENLSSDQQLRKTGDTLSMMKNMSMKREGIKQTKGKDHSLSSFQQDCFACDAEDAADEVSAACEIRRQVPDKQEIETQRKALLFQH